MLYVIQKISGGLLLRWGPHGWCANSRFAIQYPTREAAWLAAVLLGLETNSWVSVGTI